MGEGAMTVNYKKKYLEKEQENLRNQKKFELLSQWMKLKLHGLCLSEFFEDRGVSSIAIYGMGELGWLVYEELKGDSGKAAVRYGIDQRGREAGEGFRICPLEAVAERADAILITPVLITDWIEDEIYRVLGEQTTFTLEEILYELSRKHRIPSALWE